MQWINKFKYLTNFNSISSFFNNFFTQFGIIIEFRNITPKQNIMKKLFLAAIFGFTITSCGTKESSTSGKDTDSTAVDSTSMMTPSTTDTTMPAAPTDTASMKMDSATVR